ncbi:hypothetical protein EOD42_13845 [Rhodovarius crocodyli]|uniref:Uncharacterized protein n=1 Tax=Rhodovarius crocodyli TaxID=1979269 RepID=A0A437MEZ9_9PROT|nr:hypothetical protein [Rhodovarius crocodyli]RVT96195.1 hypothetical protein EOD42_13845 [Rhodovarius crocodyli]
MSDPNHLSFAPPPESGFWADAFKEASQPLEALQRYLYALHDADWEQAGPRQVGHARRMAIAILPGVMPLREEMLSQPGEAGIAARELFNFLDQLPQAAPPCRPEQARAIRRALMPAAKTGFRDRVRAFFRRAFS